MDIAQPKIHNAEAFGSELAEETATMKTAISRLPLVLLVVPLAAVAAETADIKVDPNPPGGNLPFFNPMVSMQLWLSILCIGFGMVVVVAQSVLILRLKTYGSDDIIKNFTITAVIFGAMVLIITGYNAQQTAQAFGLFGTIVGYLLGRSAGKKDDAP